MHLEWLFSRHFPVDVVVAVVFFLCESLLVIRVEGAHTVLELAVNCHLVFLIKDDSSLAKVSVKEVVLLAAFERVNIRFEVIMQPGEEWILAHIVEIAASILVEEKKELLVLNVTLNPLICNVTLLECGLQVTYDLKVVVVE